jgi:glycosyltransferase involved in cell wall biosynthesis
LEAFHAAQDRFGALAVVERGSSHIRYQNEILLEEYERCGVRFSGIDPRRVDREESEYELCNRITVQSTFAERTFLERGVPQDKIIKLPLGVDLRRFHSIPKADSVFRVLYAGHCSIRKGVRYLLEASAPITLSNYELMINGTVEPEMEALMRKHAANYRFIGFQSLERLHEVYSQASVLVLPTVEDGFAKVVTEAMACGVPVIATTNCGAPDVLEDGVEGFIVPIRDPEAIRQKTLYLYENPGVREAMGQAALARVKSLMSWEAYGPSAAAAYLRALGRHRQQS